MYWNEIEKIVTELENDYPEEDIPTEDELLVLKEMVLSLSGFEDYEVEVEKDHLKKIIEYWHDIRN